MANLTNTYLIYQDRQLILHNPDNDDIDLDIIENQLLYNSIAFTDAVITEDQLFVEAAVSGMIFAIEGMQLVFYNLDNEDIDFELQDDCLVALSQGSYDEAEIRSNQCFISLGNEIDLDNISPELAVSIHDAFMNMQRITYGLTKISYFNPLLEGTNYCETNSEGPGNLQATLTDNNEGWISAVSADNNCYFTEPYPELTIHFSNRLLGELIIRFNESEGIFPAEFNLTVSNGTQQISLDIVDYNDTILTVALGEILVDANVCVFTIHRMNKPNVPVKIEYVDLQYGVSYETNDLMGIDILEEITYANTDAQLGAISANEVTVYLNNEARSFDFNNSGSRVSRQLKKNRKIIPYLGIKAINPATNALALYWIPCGVFWSYNWVVDPNSPLATVTGFDSLGLLNKIEYKKHYVLFNATISDILEDILQAAQEELPGLQYYIDPILVASAITIPIVYFDKSSFFNALQNISSCYPMDIYCDRNFRIVCMSQSSTLDKASVAWANDNLVISTSYPTLYTSIYNIVTVNIYTATIQENVEILNQNDVTIIDGVISRTFYFNGACSNLKEIAPTYTFEYTGTVNLDSFEWYSWGCIFTFSGQGQVTSIKVVGSAVSLNTNSYAQCRNESSIAENGPNELSVNSIMIQNYAYANYLANLILANLTSTRYCAEVENRGDFLTTLNDPIYLVNGLADTNNYKVKEQLIYWDGTLKGTTKLYTRPNK